MKHVKLSLIIIGMLVLILNFTYVPWNFVCKARDFYNLSRQAGYSLIFNPPTLPSQGIEPRAAFCWTVLLDRNLLFLQTSVILVLFSSLFFAVHLFSNINRPLKKDQLPKHIQPGVRQIIGKQIKQIIIRKREKNNPPCQLFLIFSDDTAFEFYIHNTSIVPTKGIICSYPENTVESIEILNEA